MKPALDELIKQAINASKNAYIPYSQYPVGASLLATDGSIHCGCNVENASYPAGICAERTALFKAVSEGIQAFDTLIVATKNGGSPCGICRQALFEFAPALRVVCVDMNGNITIDAPLNELLLHGFGRKSLD